MTSLYNGWTKPVARITDRDLAITALQAVELTMTPERFEEWFKALIKPAGEMTIQEVRAIAEAWLSNDECDCNGGLTCTKCHPLTDDIPY